MVRKRGTTRESVRRAFTWRCMLELLGRIDGTATIRLIFPAIREYAMVHGLPDSRKHDSRLYRSSILTRPLISWLVIGTVTVFSPKTADATNLIKPGSTANSRANSKVIAA